LHQEVIATDDRTTLLALSELCYLQADRLRRSVKPWEPRRAPPYYLSAAVYAWYYLSGGSSNSVAGPSDPNFQSACELYNRALGWGLIEHGNTNAEVEFLSGRRPLAVGEIDVHFDPDKFGLFMTNYTRFLAADHYLVRGLSVRNRQPGLGAPLIAVTPPSKRTGFFRCVPATVVLRMEGGLRELGQSQCSAHLEVHSAFHDAGIRLGEETIPLQTDSTAPIAYGLNQHALWTIGELQFLSSVERVPTGLGELSPYERGKIPVVLVHGTFSSPVWWAEMLNSLEADPVVQKRCQFWWFIYNSGNPMVYSATRLRDALLEKVKELDPEGTDPNGA
jgi:hypothetical protein